MTLRDLENLRKNEERLRQKYERCIESHKERNSPYVAPAYEDWRRAFQRLENACQDYNDARKGEKTSSNTAP
jgi:hypothetical protein